MKNDPGEGSESKSCGELLQHNRFKKLLKRPLRKRIQEHFFRFNSYVFTMASSNSAFMYVFRVLYLFQIGLASILPLSTTLWGQSNLPYKILNILSIFSYIIPGSVEEDLFAIISLAFTVVFICLNLLLIWSLFDFSRNSKLPNSLIFFCSTMLCSALPFIYNVEWGYVARNAILLSDDSSNIISYISLVLSFINAIISLSLHVATAPIFLTMRPTSPSITGFKWSIIYHAIQSLAFVLATLASLFSDIVAPVLALIAVLPYAACEYLTFVNIMWQNPKVQIFHKVVNLCNAVSSLIVAIYLFADSVADEVMFVIYILLFIILYIVFQKINQKQMVSNTAKLDQFEQVNSFDEAYEMTPKQLAQLLKFGFFNGHSFCHSWRAFDLAEERFPRDRNLIILSLKCSSIYPDESSRLKEAIIRAIGIKKHDFELKKLIAEGQSLLQQRERNLSKNLKKQLNKIKEKSDRCIGHVRHIWECIIRGSVAEIESLSGQLKKLEEDVQKEYAQLLSIYSNNPYVTRAYAQFLTDVACNAAEGSRYFHMYKTLRAGARVLNEKSYFFALHEFPSLPPDDLHSQMVEQKSIECMPADQQPQEKSIQSFTMGQSQASEDRWDEEKEIENNGYIESLVNTVHLPSLKITKGIIFFILIIASLASTIPFLILFTNQMDSIVTSYTSFQALTRTLAAYVRASNYAIQYAVSTKGYSKNLKDRFIDLLEGYGNYQIPDIWVDDATALRETMKIARGWSEQLEQIMPTLKETGYFPRTISMLYEPQFEHEFYSDLTDLTNLEIKMTVSFQSIVTVYLNSLMAVLENPEEAFENVDFMTIANNCFTSVQIASSIIDECNIEYQEMVINGEEEYDIYILVFCILILVLAVFSIFYIVYKVGQDKALIYSSFKALPKSSISSIIQKLNVSMNKNIDDSETHKLSIQEENALRLLSTTNTKAAMNTNLILFFIAPLVVFFVAYIVIFVLLYTVPQNIYESILDVPPGLRTILNLASYEGAFVNYAFRYGLQSVEEYKNAHADNPAAFKMIILILLSDYSRFTQELWFGTNKDGNGLDSIGEIYEILSTSTCEMEDMLLNDIGLIHCGSLETSSYLIFQRLLELFNSNTPPELDSVIISFALYWVQHKGYEQGLSLAFDTSTNTMSQKDSELFNKMTLPCIILLIIIVLFALFSIGGIDKIGADAVWSLRLLLFCQQQTVLNSKIILKILSNDFSRNDEDTLSQGASFYETLCSHLLNGALFLDNQLIIRSANTAVQNILGVKGSDIIGRNIHTVLKPPPGKEAGLHAFFTAVDGAMAQLRSPEIECEAEIIKGDDTITVQFNLVAVSISGEVQTTPTNAEGLSMLALVMKDLTSTIAARTLLKEEHDKGEHLLGMILPQIIVQQLQRGDSNISFSVQSASILFMDIVSFTPWCGSLPAAVVMKTLNKMFAVFDKCLSQHDRMIKIKCIGDCYMDAGGIFDEVNQPAEHCKQAISFCLEAISSLELFNIENKQSLRIRAGINCGGPITAGVLGVEKPTFDILGPAISVAAMMEHHGVPMNVHIPQHMYELVYDQPFQFKERGDVEIKGKMIHTYLVTGFA